MALRAIPASLLPASCIPASLHPASCTLLLASLLPCFPASCFPAARLAALSPEARSCAAGRAQRALSVLDGGAMVWWGTPWTCPGGMSRGYPTPPWHHRPALTGPLSTPRRAGMGLWAQGGSQGPCGAGFSRLQPAPLLYLRLFPPGQRIPPKAGFANDWIGSRSEPPRGGSDVQDLVGLSIRCASTGFGR